MVTTAAERRTLRKTYQSLEKLFENIKIQENDGSLSNKRRDALLQALEINRKVLEDFLPCVEPQDSRRHDLLVHLLEAHLKTAALLQQAENDSAINHYIRSLDLLGILEDNVVEGRPGSWSHSHISQERSVVHYEIGQYYHDKAEQLGPSHEEYKKNLVRACEEYKKGKIASDRVTVDVVSLRLRLTPFVKKANAAAKQLAPEEATQPEIPGALADTVDRAADDSTPSPVRSSSEPSIKHSVPGVSALGPNHPEMQETHPETVRMENSDVVDLTITKNHSASAGQHSPISDRSVVAKNGEEPELVSYGQAERTPKIPAMPSVTLPMPISPAASNHICSANDDGTSIRASAGDNLSHLSAAAAALTASTSVSGSDEESSTSSMSMIGTGSSSKRRRLSTPVHTFPPPIPPELNMMAARCSGAPASPSKGAVSTQTNNVLPSVVTQTNTVSPSRRNAMPSPAPALKPTDVMAIQPVSPPPQFTKIHVANWLANGIVTATQFQELYPRAYSFTGTEIVSTDVRQEYTVKLYAPKKPSKR